MRRESARADVELRERVARPERVSHRGRPWPGAATSIRMAKAIRSHGLAVWPSVLPPELCLELRREALDMLRELQQPSLRAAWHQLQRWLLDPIREPKASFGSV